MSCPTLWALPYSPWSEKARWALDASRVPYREREYVPIFAEPVLRLKSSDWGRRVSVPALELVSEMLCDSYQIARWCDDNSGRTSLCDGEKVEEVVALSEQILAAGRALVLAKTRNNPRAKLESLPSVFPQVVRKLSAPLVSLGMAYLDRKYEISDLHHPEDRVRQGCERMRELLGGRTYMSDSFGFADIAGAVALQVVSPVDDKWVRLGPNTRECWTIAPLASEFSDLIDWRNEMYARHR